MEINEIITGYNTGYNSLWFWATPKFSIFNTADFSAEYYLQKVSERNHSITVKPSMMIYQLIEYTSDVNVGKKECE